MSTGESDDKLASLNHALAAIRAYIQREFPDWSLNEVATVAVILTREGFDAGTVTRSTAIEAYADYCKRMSQGGYIKPLNEGGGRLSAEERASYAAKAKSLVELIRKDKS